MRRTAGVATLLTAALAAPALLLAPDDPRPPVGGAPRDAVVTPAPPVDLAAGEREPPASATTPAPAVASAPVVVRGHVRLLLGGRWPHVEVVATRDRREVVATTDDQGAFSLALAPGPWTIALRPAAGLEARWIAGAPPDDDAWTAEREAPLEQRVDVAADETRMLDLRVRSQVVVAGRVVDDSDGAPVAGAEVRLAHGAARVLDLRASSDASGRFAIVADSSSWLPDTAIVRAPGRAPAAVSVSHGVILLGCSGTLKRMHAAGLEVRLPLPLRLTGRVEDAHGAPLAGARVEVRADIPVQDGRAVGAARRPESPVPWTWHATAGPDGEFTVEDLAASLHPAHTEAQVSASLEGYAERRPVSLLVGPEGARTRLRLERPAAVSGRVVDASGAPLAGARVARFPDENGPRFVWVRGSLRDSGPARLGPGEALAYEPRHGRAAGTGPDGAFQLDGLLPGPQRLSVSAPGFGERVIDVQAPTSDLRVALAPERVLSGRLVDHVGRPLGFAEVRILKAGQGETAWPNDLDPSDERGAAVTDHEGAFVVRGLAGDDVDVIACDGSVVVATRLGVRLDGEPLLLRADPPPTTVEVEAVDLDTGASLASWHEAWSLDGQRLRDPWSVRAPTRFAVVVGARGYALARVEVEPAPGGTAVARARLRAGGGRLRVGVDLPRWPVRRLTLDVVHEVSGVRAREELEPGLRAPAWSTPLLPPGAVTVTATAHGADGTTIERRVSAQALEAQTVPVLVVLD
ncbi:MAG: carboxypeptidase regulatory-like domain-containing protein [Planctomycetes bacterium]|nr:carboxypeptidase regulatory-like domain-containing protein [Planctomycetota bacterium]